MFLFKHMWTYWESTHQEYLKWSDDIRILLYLFGKLDCSSPFWDDPSTDGGWSSMGIPMGNSDKMVFSPSYRVWKHEFCLNLWALWAWDWCPNGSHRFTSPNSWGCEFQQIYVFWWCETKSPKKGDINPKPCMMLRCHVNVGISTIDHLSTISGRHGTFPWAAAAGPCPASTRYPCLPWNAPSWSLPMANHREMRHRNDQQRRSGRNCGEQKCGALPSLVGGLNPSEKY